MVKLIVNHLLGHLRSATDAVTMHSIVFLKAKQLVRRLLRKELNSNTLVVHGDLGLLPHVLPGHRVSDTARTVLIFLDGAD